MSERKSGLEKNWRREVRGELEKTIRLWWWKVEMFELSIEKKLAASNSSEFRYHMTGSFGNGDISDATGDLIRSVETGRTE
jgi:hypothetical protein